eukprot:ctg_1944.g460
MFVAGVGNASSTWQRAHHRRPLSWRVGYGVGRWICSGGDRLSAVSGTRWSRAARARVWPLGVQMMQADRPYSRVSLLIGSVCMLVLLWSRAVGGDVLAAGPRAARTDILGVAAAGLLLVYAVSSVRVPVRSTAPVAVRDGVLEPATVWVASGGDDEARQVSRPWRATLTWLVDALFDACPFTSTVLVLSASTGHVWACRGVVRSRELPAVDWAEWETSGLLPPPDDPVERYFAELRVIPANERLFALLPRDTQAAVTFRCGVLPTAAADVVAAVILIGYNKVRPLVDADLRMIRYLAQAPPPPRR